MAVGACIVAALVGVLAWLGAPTPVSILPWAVPTAAAIGWTLIRPSPAIATDDDDDSWPGYAIEFVLIGENTSRGAITRVIAAAVFGAPIVWALLVFGLSTLAGLA